MCIRDRSKHNVVFIGTKNLYQDVENLYKKEFKSSVDEYNSRQKRADRKIYDCLLYTSRCV